jgi:hypothetical protein
MSAGFVRLAGHAGRCGGGESRRQFAAAQLHDVVELLAVDRLHHCGAHGRVGEGTALALVEDEVEVAEEERGDRVAVAIGEAIGGLGLNLRDVQLTVEHEVRGRRGVGRDDVLEVLRGFTGDVGRPLRPLVVVVAELVAVSHARLRVAQDVGSGLGAFDVPGGETLGIREPGGAHDARGRGGERLDEIGPGSLEVDRDRACGVVGRDARHLAAESLRHDGAGRVRVGLERVLHDGRRDRRSIGAGDPVAQREGGRFRRRLPGGREARHGAALVHAHEGVEAGAGEHEVGQGHADRGVEGRGDVDGGADRVGVDRRLTTTASAASAAAGGQQKRASDGERHCGARDAVCHGVSFRR